MMADQFAPYEPEYLKQWRKRLDDPKPAKPAVKKRKGKKAKVKK